MISCFAFCRRRSHPREESCKASRCKALPTKASHCKAPTKTSRCQALPHQRTTCRTTKAGRCKALPAKGSRCQALPKAHPCKVLPTKSSQRTAKTSRLTRHRRTKALLSRSKQAHRKPKVRQPSKSRSRVLLKDQRPARRVNDVNSKFSL